MALKGNPPSHSTAQAETLSEGSRVGSSTIEQSFSTKRNSLNFLRLILALAVVFSHSITLGGFGSESILGKTTLGTVAVFGFFGISGYLIAGSADHNNVGRYLWQRFLRIFPAFWICLLITAFLFGALAWIHYQPALSSACGLHCYVTEPGGPFAYVRNNFWLQVNQDTIAKTLPGGFLGYGWNGSLWTLELEFFCYVLLAAFSVFGLLKRPVIVASIAAGVWIAEIVIVTSRALSPHFTPLFGSDWITFFAFKVEVMKVLLLVPIFLSGSLLYLYRDKVPDSGVIALGATLLFLAGMVIPVGQGANDYFQTSLNLTAIFLVYPLIWLGIHLPFARVCAVNDYSYGIYIYAFPIQQLLVLWGINRWGYWSYTLVTLAAVVPFAVASWWLIEKHALRLKKLKVPVPFRSKSP
jgi:peptidoglycan/LPS O-acetylase OafA/YrhL